MSLLRGVKRLRALQEHPSSASRDPRPSFSISTSPLTRLLTEHIGKGQPAKLLQQVAAAASVEADGNISASVLDAKYYVAQLFARFGLLVCCPLCTQAVNGQLAWAVLANAWTTWNINSTALLLDRAATCAWLHVGCIFFKSGDVPPSKAPIRCQIRGASIRVKDLRDSLKLKLAAARTQRKRLLRRQNTVPVQKKCKPKKKSKNVKDRPTTCESWPVLLPEDIFDAHLHSGHISKLFLGTCVVSIQT